MRSATEETLTPNKPMDHPSELKAELVELVYDLLSEQRAAELRTRIADDPETAALYERVKREASLIADASRWPTGKSLFEGMLPQGSEENTAMTENAVDNRADARVDDRATGISMPDVAETGTTQVAHSGHDRPQMFRLMPWEFAKRAFQQERTVNRIMSRAAICLVMVTIGGFLYQRYQTSQVADMPLRIVAAVPESLAKDAPQSLQVQVTDLLGERRQVPVRVSLNSVRGDELAAVAGQTSPDGRLLLPLAELTGQLDFENDTPLQLEISAGKQPVEKYAVAVNMVEKPRQAPVDYPAKLAAINRELNDDDSFALANAERAKIFDRRYSVANTILETTPGVAPMSQPMPQQNSLDGELPYRNSQMATNQAVYFPEQRMAQSYLTPRRSSAPAAPSTSSTDMFDEPERQPEPQSRLARDTGGGRAVYNSPAMQDQSEVGDVDDGGAIGQLRSRGMTSMSAGRESDADHNMYGMGGMSGGMGMSEMSSTFSDKDNTRFPEADLSPDIALFAEGGRLVVGLRNRIFFRATVADEPIRQLTGKVVDDRDQKIAELECDVDGFGQFYIEPQTERRYRLIVDRWETASRQSGNSVPFETVLTLPESDAPVGIGLARHVISTDEPVTVHLRSRRADLPVVVTASQRGIALLSEFVIANQGVTSVRLPLAETVTGPVEIAVFDAQREPFATLGTETCLRRPARWLTVSATLSPTSTQTTSVTQNDQASRRVELTVFDADGKPVPNADVSVHLLREISPETLPETLPPSRHDRLFAAVPSETGLRNLTSGFSASNRLVDWQTLENLLTSNDATATQTLDFLVATGGLPFGDGERSEQTVGQDARKPVIIDNLAGLRAGYDQKIETFRQNRQIRGYVVGLFVIFGGMALAVLSMILVVMRLASGSRMFVVATVSGLACVFVCMLMLRGTNDDNVVALTKQPTFASSDMQVVAVRPRDHKNEAQVDSKPETFSSHHSILRERTEQERRSVDESHLIFFGASTLSSGEPTDQRRRNDTANGFPLEIKYEHVTVCTDSEGRASFETLLPVNTSNDSAISLVIDAESSKGEQGMLRIDFNEMQNLVN